LSQKYLAVLGLGIGGPPAGEMAGRPLGKWRAARWGNGGPPAGNCHFLVGCQDTQDTQDTQEF
jgi:hypothetical protein